eukprot:sb/3466088/
MGCNFECKTKYRKQLQFTSTSDWADTTALWEGTRKRKCPNKKPPPGYLKPTKKSCADARPRRPAYSYLDTHSAGLSRLNPVKPPLQGATGCVGDGSDKEPLKCKLVNFTGTGTKLCISSEMRAHSVPNVAEDWGIAEFEDNLSHRSVASTINLDSGKSQMNFQKEQLLLQLHQRSASLTKYLFQDQQRSFNLHMENISLPIRPPRRFRSDALKKKNIILEPKSDRFGEDYLGALIPNSSRPLGYGLVSHPGSGKELKVSHKTLEFPPRPLILSNGPVLGGGGGGAFPAPRHHGIEKGVHVVKIPHEHPVHIIRHTLYYDEVLNVLAPLLLSDRSSSRHSNHKQTNNYKQTNVILAC